MRVINQNNDFVSTEIVNMISTLRNLRKLQKLTQRDVAKLTGIAYQNICRMEKGGVTPTLPFLIKYINAINSKLEITKLEKVLKTQHSE